MNQTTSSLLPSTMTRKCFAAWTISDWSGGGTRKVSAVATSRNEIVTSGLGWRPARERTRPFSSAYQRAMLPSFKRIWATISCRRMWRRNSGSTRAHVRRTYDSPNRIVLKPARFMVEEVRRIQLICGAL